jgi:two-component system response regulator AtoC
MSDPGFLPHSVALSMSPHREAKGKVLVVDDEYLIRYSLKRIIEGEGYAVCTAGSGQEALRLFEEQVPDIVILDIHLPDSNGLSLLRTIKERRPAVAAIMATGCPDALNRVEAMKMGALDYLEKPVDMNILKGLMHRTTRAAA